MTRVGSDVTTVGDDTIDQTEERGRFAPTVLQALSFAVAVAFLSSVVTAWWVTRDPAPNATEVGFYDDIRQMRASLQRWRREGTPGVAMEWMGMSVPQDAQPSMATDAQLTELIAARGRKLDDLFSRLVMT